MEGLNSMAAQSGLPMFGEEPACSQYCPNLTFQQRVMGFFGCAAFGWIFSMMGTMTLLGGPTTKNITTFIVLYVIGNIIALCATGFLLGPKTQCRQMWQPTRRYSTAAYLLLLIVVFISAVAGAPFGLVLFFFFCEVLAALWYSLSYIPFARDLVKGGLRRTICKPCCEAWDQARGHSGGGGSSGAGGGVGGGTYNPLFVKV